MPQQYQKKCYYMKLLPFDQKNEAVFSSEISYET